MQRVLKGEHQIRDVTAQRQGERQIRDVTAQRQGERQIRDVTAQRQSLTGAHAELGGKKAKLVTAYRLGTK